MRRGSRIVAPLLAVGLLLSACGTPAAPAAPAATTAPAAPTAAAKPTAAAASTGAASNDAEWQKILQAAKGEGKVLIYGALLAGPEGASIADQFQKQTGISVDFVSGSGSPLYQRIREESKNGTPSADIFEGSQPWPSIVLKDGYFVALKGKPLPVLSEQDSSWYVPPMVASANAEYVASRFPSNPGHILVNTQVLKPEDYPKSFHELATDPKYKGKIVWVNPKSTGDVAYKYVLWEYLSKSFPLADIWNVYSKQEPLMLPAPMDGGGAIARGEGAIAYSTSQIEGLFQSGAPMKLLFFPDTPYVEGVAGMGLVKDAPHPNAALVFINWVLSKEGQTAITTTAGYRSVRRDVPDGTPPGLKAEVVGGGKRGPTYLLTGAQATLAGDLHTAGVFLNLPDGIAEPAFEEGVKNYVKEWESKNGGPQDQPVTLGG